MCGGKLISKYLYIKIKTMSKEMRKLIDNFKTFNNRKLNENIDDEILDIKDNIELYDDNYNVYRRRYLQTQSDDDKYQMNKWLKLRKEQEELLKNKLG
jgi:hypothetical protein